MAYQIKTVARLTGIPRNTLLAWERRYDLIQPARADNGYREYSDEDIATLTSVKQLIDQGYRISEAAQLVLDGNSGDDTDDAEVQDTGLARVAILHTTFGEQLRAAGGAGRVEVVQEADQLGRLGLAGGVPDAHVLIADLELLGAERRRALRRALSATGAEHAIVLYAYATNSAIEELVAEGARLIRQPTRVSQVLDTVRRLTLLQDALRRRRARQNRARARPARIPGAPGAGAPVSTERRFTDAQLARLREYRSPVECECPNHLSSLATALLGFERYSAQCEDQSPQDAEMHAYLGHHTARARRIVEDMLWELCEQDGIKV